MSRQAAAIAMSVGQAVRPDGISILGSTSEERLEAALRSRIEFYENEQKLVRTYIEVLDSGEVSVLPDDGSEAPEGSLVHLSDLLDNYGRLIFEQLGALEVELNRIEGALEPCCDDEDCECAISTT